MRGEEVGRWAGVEREKDGLGGGFPGEVEQ